MGSRSPFRTSASRGAFHVLGEERFEWLRASYMAIRIKAGRIQVAELALLPEVVRPGDVVIDVGANYGLFSFRLARLVGETGRVFAFEAVPATIKALRHVLKWTGVSSTVEVVEAGASDADGDVVMAITRRADGIPERGTAWSSPAGAMSPEVLTRLQAELGGPTVRMTRLDSAIPRDADVAFIKTDIEGADLFALRGARELITRSCPTLLMEVSSDSLSRHGLRREDLQDYLDRHGYFTYRYLPNHRLERARATEIDGDLLAVHPRRAARVEHLFD
jgi:FkbM family methyltransferase